MIMHTFQYVSQLVMPSGVALVPGHREAAARAAALAQAAAGGQGGARAGEALFDALGRAGAFARAPKSW